MRFRGTVCFEFWSLIPLLTFFQSASDAAEVIYAINCGGEAHTDSNGIHYMRDPSQVGIASDFGKQWVIARVVEEDQVLYQTERYHHNTFGYNLPIPGDGDYVLVIKFSEVYFNQPRRKVFDVVLNKEHTVVSDLDIWSRVRGRAIAYDEIIPFSVKKNQLYVMEEESEIHDDFISMEFIKGVYDNPKVNAFYLLRGKMEDVPPLPPLTDDTSPPEEEGFSSQIKGSTELPTAQSQFKRTSGPRAPDPYADDDSSMMLPVFVAIGAFIPILFCLCQL